MIQIFFIYFLFLVIFSSWVIWCQTPTLFGFVNALIKFIRPIYMNNYYFSTFPFQMPSMKEVLVLALLLGIYALSAHSGGFLGNYPPGCDENAAHQVNILSYRVVEKTF